MTRLSGRTCRISVMLAMTLGFFFVEIVIGYVTHSLALIADSFHMLSDVVSLIIGLYAVRVAKKTSSVKNTYGWIRAEVLGALFNGVFLLALCFSIFVEAIQRFAKIEKIENPKLLLIVGGIGLLINVIGLFLFSDHAHSHGGSSHGHSHGGNKADDHEKKEKSEVESHDIPPMDVFTHSHEIENQPSSSKKKGQLNMHGVFLHVLGDALGSVAVIISALVVWLSNWEHSSYLDPALSLLIVLIISFHTIPMVRQSAMILLQAIPNDVDISALQSNLRTLQGIVDIHELHIWQLAEEKLIASVHVTVLDRNSFMETASQMKQIFHDSGIHSSTIQPEFVNDNDDEATCLLACEAECATNVCCTKDKRDKIRENFHRRNVATQNGRDGTELTIAVVPNCHTSQSQSAKSH